MWSPSDDLRFFVKQFNNDDAQDFTADLQSCGPDIVRQFQESLHSLLGDDSARQQLSLAQLDAIIDVSYTRMSSALGVPCPLCWRSLYTDASIVRSLADIAFSVPPVAIAALNCIARLDKAIVIAGAPGRGRLDFILDTIENIQSTYLPRRPFEALNLPDAASLSPSNQILVESTMRVVPRIEPPSLIAFQRVHSQSPFILRGHVRDWPAMQEHPWSSTDYLRSIAGPGRVVPVEVGSDYRNDDWTQKMMKWDEFLEALDSSGEQKETNVLYLAQHDLMKQFRPLRRDVIVPDYVYASLPLPADFPAYRPPGNDEQLVINAWLGPAGTVSPAHTDPFYNLYVLMLSIAQVVGRKTVWLAPPSVSEFMYPYPPSLPTTNKSHGHNPAANTTNPSMSNTSQVDVFDHSAAENDSGSHSGFLEKVIPEAMIATLEPGDLLFFPPGWWHAMRSEEKSFSVSMWF